MAVSVLNEILPVSAIPVGKAVAFKLFYLGSLACKVHIDKLSTSVHTLAKSAYTGVLSGEAEGLVFLVPLLSESLKMLFCSLDYLGNNFICKSLKLCLVACAVSRVKLKTQR